LLITIRSIDNNSIRRLLITIRSTDNNSIRALVMIHLEQSIWVLFQPLSGEIYDFGIIPSHSHSNLRGYPRITLKTRRIQETARKR
jgi:hypothetical protein